MVDEEKAVGADGVEDGVGLARVGAVGLVGLVVVAKELACPVYCCVSMSCD